MRHSMHFGLVNIIQSIFKDAVIPNAYVFTKARGLRSTDSFRTNDGIALDFFADGIQQVKGLCPYVVKTLVPIAFVWIETA
jgi:hypothetical protein